MGVCNGSESVGRESTAISDDQLSAWFSQTRTLKFPPGFVFIDLDELKGHIVVGVENVNVSCGRILADFERLGIPLEVVEVVHASPVVQIDDNSGSLEWPQLALGAVVLAFVCIGAFKLRMRLKRGNVQPDVLQ